MIKQKRFLTPFCGPFCGPGVNWCGADPDVAEESLIGLVQRLEGLMMGSTFAIEKIQVFGSRAGSTLRGPGPLPDSDLDVLITGEMGLMGSRWEKRITEIIADIDGTNLHGTNIKLQINADWKFDIKFSDIGPPLIEI